MKIRKVRHLANITVPVADKQIKHLILTGKNGSGKTSVVEAMAGYLNNLLNDKHFVDREQWLNSARNKRDQSVHVQKGEAEIVKLEKDFCKKEQEFEQKGSCPKP